MRIHGLARPITRETEGRRPLRVTAMGSLATAGTELPYAEQARAGVRYIGASTGTTGIGNVTSIATPTANVALFNGAPAGGPSLYLDRVGTYLTSTGGGSLTMGGSLAVAVSPAAISTIPAGGQASGWTISSCSGALTQSVARWVLSLTLPNVPGTNASPTWAIVASYVPLAGATGGIGPGAYTDLEGSIVIPPGYALGFNAFVGITSNWGVCASWGEW